jgi:hypothetical protein
MPDGLSNAIAAVATALLLAVGGSLFVECLLKPRSRCRLRRIPGYSVHLGLTTITFTLLLALTQRPYFAAALTATTTLVIVIVSNAKYRALREPFVFTDFGLFSQALRHPRLYLPFLGLVPALVGLSTAVAAVIAGITLEPAVSTKTGVSGLAMITLILFLPAGFLLAAATRRTLPLTLDPVRDIADHGLLSSLWLYWLAERRQGLRTNAGTIIERPISSSAGFQDLPPIIAVQSESFFDVRRLWPDIAPEILSNFDRIRRAAMLSGRLEVPAWGANTMRTEFAFLSGISADELGVHRFNPYRRLARNPIPTLASRLQQIGYHTICLHPHPAGFFGRDQVIPQLGFNEFLDIASFTDAPHDGPYIADAAVTAKILELLQQASRPTFIFAITMENHGPLHLERVTASDRERLFTQPPPQDCDDLSVYLRHLQNADHMIGQLGNALTERHHNGLLCFFGDHVPSMPRVYDVTGFPDGRSDYLVWSPGRSPGTELDTRVEALGDLLLKSIGLSGTSDDTRISEVTQAASGPAKGRKDPRHVPALHRPDAMP